MLEKKQEKRENQRMKTYKFEEWNDKENNTEQNKFKMMKYFQHCQQLQVSSIEKKFEWLNPIPNHQTQLKSFIASLLPSWNELIRFTHKMKLPLGLEVKPIAQKVSRLNEWNRK